MNACARRSLQPLTGLAPQGLAPPSVYPVEHGIGCARCQLAIEKDIISSRGEGWPYQAREKVYAKDDFLEHFRWCDRRGSCGIRVMKGEEGLRSCQ